ncbi:MAG: hypothetical protein IH591_12655 [Bacteroidales bacterium]|nr:hypothetical protein [Bacteroidales bacterium]
MGIRYNLLLNLKNIPGRRIKRKIVVIESDDWGGIRMPSERTFNQLLSNGIPVDKGAFDKYDTLADKDDLELLFEVLSSVRDKYGHSAVMTPVTNVANPNFEKIKDSGFENYYYEPFSETLIRYGRHSDTIRLWTEGIESGLFVPEFHGREHIAVQHWLQKLREGNKKLRMAFDYGYVYVPIEGLHRAVSSFRPAFFMDNPTQADFLKESITDGVRLFVGIFNFHPCALIPSDGIFHPLLEKTVVNSGVKYLNVDYFQSVPDFRGNLKTQFYGVLSKSNIGLIYYHRNCAFEPVHPDYKGIDLTVKQIETAFRWGKVAIICTHRANFVGGIDCRNRDRGLRALKDLLNMIINKWPDVEFMSLASMLRSFYHEHNSHR